MGKIFAIIDLTGAYHGSMFGSSKIYYNPETKLLEPMVMIFTKEMEVLKILF